MQQQIEEAKQKRRARKEKGAESTTSESASKS